MTHALLDSNILIYATQPRHDAVRDFIAAHAPAISVISRVEVLGYHRLRDEERVALEDLFASAELLPVSEAVIEFAIALRQRRKMSLGDSIVAGTALAHGRTLVTHNTADFDWIPDLPLLDPLGDRTDPA
jgi:toxin FitB